MPRPLFTCVSYRAEYSGLNSVFPRAVVRKIITENLIVTSHRNCLQSQIAELPVSISYLHTDSCRAGLHQTSIQVPETTVKTKSYARCITFCSRSFTSSEMMVKNEYRLVH